MPSFRNTLMAAAALALTAAGGTAFARNPMVGGAAMYPTRTIVANAVNSRDHTTLVAAVKAAGLVDTLSGPGPFTVFAPTNAAFAKLPAGTVETLVKPENKAMLTGILTYHVVPGRITAAMIAANARAHGGRATYTTVQGEPLTFMRSGMGWSIMDAKGGHAMITIANVMQSNGIIHVIDTVLMP
ncbi:MAG: fasciclin [Novosphingobium sp.]|nr:fasciclin [Novosphingobium sp.]